MVDGRATQNNDQRQTAIMDDQCSGSIIGANLLQMAKNKSQVKYTSNG